MTLVKRQGVNFAHYYLISFISCIDIFTETFFRTLLKSELCLESFRFYYQGMFNFVDLFIKTTKMIYPLQRLVNIFFFF